MKIRFFLLSIALLLQGCAGSQALTEEQRARQDAVESLVANALFEHDLDSLAAYHVGADGYVQLNFHATAAFAEYDPMVRELRQHAQVKGVYAEQSGGEVCPMKPLGR